MMSLCGWPLAIFPALGGAPPTLRRLPYFEVAQPPGVYRAEEVAGGSSTPIIVGYVGPTWLRGQNRARRTWLALPGASLGIDETHDFASQHRSAANSCAYSRSSTGGHSRLFVGPISWIRVTSDPV